MSLPPLHLIRAKHWVRHATPQARRIVLDIFRAGSPETTLSTHAIHDQCLKVDARVPPQFIPPGVQVDPRTAVTVHSNSQVPVPTHPFHPIRSVAYLKRVVLLDLEARGIIAKILHRREPNADELRDLAKHAASIERRNKRKLAAGMKPTSIVPTIFSVFEWALTDLGRKLLFTKKEQTLPQQTGERDGQADHLDSEQLREIKAAPWAMREDQYGFWIPPSRAMTGLPLLPPGTAKHAKAMAKRRRVLRHSTLGTSSFLGPQDPGKSTEYDRWAAQEAVRVRSAQDGAYPWPNSSSTSSPSASSSTNTPEDVRRPAPGVARVWVPRHEELPAPSSSTVPSPSTHTSGNVNKAALRVARVWTPGHGELPPPSISALLSASTKTRERSATQPSRPAPSPRGTPSKPPRVSFGLRAPTSSSFPYASSIQNDRPEGDGRGTAPRSLNSEALPRSFDDALDGLIGKVAGAQAGRPDGDDRRTAPHSLNSEAPHHAFDRDMQQPHALRLDRDTPPHALSDRDNPPHASAKPAGRTPARRAALPLK